MPAPATAGTDGELTEVFSSIQGEGLLVGWRQVFVRMAGCNLDCDYCDTPFAPTQSCRIEDAPGSGLFRSLGNPVALETLYNILHGWNSAAPGLHHSISLTGGEPLCQADLLAEWCPDLSRILPLFLETNGTLPEALEPLLPHLTWVAMDLKLPSMTGVPSPWERHREFLRIASRKECFVKVVVGEETPSEELDSAARLVHESAPGVPLILQPVSRKEGPGMTPRQLLDLQARIARIHPSVRVIPQTHRYLGVL